MKRKILTLIFSMAAVALMAKEPIVQEPGRVDLISSWCKFTATQPPKGILSREKSQDKFNGPDSDKQDFSVKFNVDLTNTNVERKLLEIPGIMTVRLRQADPAVRDNQNYPAFLMADGTLPVLEATLVLHAPTVKPFRREMVIGCPLAMLSDPKAIHEVVINFTGARWTLFVDGMTVDNDFPIGYPNWNRENGWSIDAQCVNSAEVFFPALKTERDQSKTHAKRPNVQYWTPVGHNSWVGDVATLFFNGRYHLFYLYDRRHHSSKLGCGGHYFEHLSTTDFVTWTEHESATPIEEQWETFGTGTPFVFDGKLCISYGLHSSRIYPEEDTMSKEEVNYFRQNGKTGSFNSNPEKVIPSGATYSISKDGISNFQKTGIIYHYCENPSIYTDPEGKLRMIANYRAKGMWESDTPDGGWRCINENFPPGGDCTFFFRWEKYDYIIGGFTGLWNKPVGAKESEWQSMVEKGLDFYDGLNVPAVSQIGDGRFLMAGWLPLRGWGGPLVIHEMIQLPDGRIGTKWMKELTPATSQSIELAKKIIEPVSFDLKERAYILSFDVCPKKAGHGKLSLSFLPGDGAVEGCEFQIDLDKNKAQYADAVHAGFAEPEKSLREGGAPQAVANYAIENLLGTEKDFTVRMVVKANDKWGATLFDTEIAGKRTMVSLRPDLDVNSLSVKTDGVELRNFTIAPIEEE